MRTKGPLKRCMQLYELAVSHGMLPHLYMENKEVPGIHIRISKIVNVSLSPFLV